MKSILKMITAIIRTILFMAKSVLGAIIRGLFIIIAAIAIGTGIVILIGHIAIKIITNPISIILLAIICMFFVITVVSAIIAVIKCLLTDIINH